MNAKVLTLETPSAFQASLSDYLRDRGDIMAQSGVSNAGVSLHSLSGFVRSVDKGFPALVLLWVASGKKVQYSPVGGANKVLAEFGSAFSPQPSDLAEALVALGVASLEGLTKALRDQGEEWRGQVATAEAGRQKAERKAVETEAAFNRRKDHSGEAERLRAELDQANVRIDSLEADLELATAKKKVKAAA